MSTIQSKKDTLKKILYRKEYKIAGDINQSLQDIENGKSRPISELFSEMDNTKLFK